MRIILSTILFFYLSNSVYSQSHTMLSPDSSKFSREIMYYCLEDKQQKLDSTQYSFITQLSIWGKMNFRKSMSEFFYVFIQPNIDMSNEELMKSYKLLEREMLDKGILQKQIRMKIVDHETGMSINGCGTTVSILIKPKINGKRRFDIFLCD